MEFQARATLRAAEKLRYDNVLVQPEFDKRVYLFKVDTKIIVDSSHIDLYILLTRNEKSIGLRGCLAIFRFYAFFILGFLLLRQIVLLSSFSCLLEFSVSGLFAVYRRRDARSPSR